jgi:hypothetical protein
MEFVIKVIVMAISLVKIMAVGFWMEEMVIPMKGWKGHLLYFLGIFLTATQPPSGTPIKWVGALLKVLLAANELENNIRIIMSMITNKIVFSSPQMSPL